MASPSRLHERLWHALAVPPSVRRRGQDRQGCCVGELEWLEDRTLLSNFLVSNAGDHGSGTLRDAIEKADLNPGSTIKFGVTGTITLSSMLPHLSKPVTITGPGSSLLRVQRSLAADTSQFGVFTVSAGVRATISGLTIAGGNASSGGGIANLGNLTVSNCVLVGNSATYGGGLYNASRLTVFNTTLSANSATHGGGIFSSGRLSVIGSTFSGDSATYIGTADAAATDAAAEDALAEARASAAATVTLAYTSEAAIDRGDVEATLAVAKSVAAAGRAAAAPANYGGGAILNMGTLTASHSSFLGNSAACGGSIANYGTAMMSNCVLSGNVAAFGGGIGNVGTLTVGDSALSGNVAAFGGGIANVGPMTISNSTLSGNSASQGGGIDNLGSLTVINSTLSENSAATDLNGSGGGIVNLGALTVINSLLSGNSASHSGGGIANFGQGTLTLDNSILSGNEAVDSAGIFSASTLLLINGTPYAPAGNTVGSASIGGPFVNTSATVIPQSIASSISASSSESTASPSPITAAPSATIGAPPARIDAASAAAGPHSADTAVLFADISGYAADTSKALPGLAALSTAIIALASAPGANVTRLVPLRESALALVGTLLVLTLETSTNDEIPRSSALDPRMAVLVGPGSALTISLRPSSSARSARMSGGAIESDGNSKDDHDARSAREEGKTWEHFVIGLDEDFEQFRREFCEQPRDEARSMSDGEQASSLRNDLTGLWSPVAYAHVRRKTGTSHALRSRSGTVVDAIRVVPRFSDAVRNVDTPAKGLERGGASFRQSPDTEGMRPLKDRTWPLRVALSWLAIALASGHAWMQRQQQDRPE